MRNALLQCITKSTLGHYWAGIMIGETIHDLEEGTSQDGPLWPLLSKILLYDLDKELADGRV